MSIHIRRFTDEELEAIQRAVEQFDAEFGFKVGIKSREEFVAAKGGNGPFSLREYGQCVQDSYRKGEELITYLRTGKR